MAKIIITANLINKPMIAKSSQRERVFVGFLERAFKQAGWHVEAEPYIGHQADLLVSKGPHSYVIELKVAHEGRKDRVIPLLSMAILEAQAVANKHPPLGAMAVVAAPRISESLADEVLQFVSRNAPGVPVGMIDLEGF